MNTSRRDVQLQRTVAVILLSTVLASCDSGASDTQAPPAGEVATAISKEEFLAQANEICVEAEDELDQALAEDDGSTREEFFLGEVIPSIRRQMENWEQLGFPEGDEERIRQIIDDTEAILSDLEANPETLGAQPDPFSEVNEQMAEYGLDGCV